MRHLPVCAGSRHKPFLPPPTVPLADRAAELRSPLYEAMLRALVHHAALPLHFTRWEEEGEADQDTFVRLRCGGPPLGLHACWRLASSTHWSHPWVALRFAWQTAFQVCECRSKAGSRRAAKLPT